MSKIKLLLDVVEDLRSLANSIQAVCESLSSVEEEKSAPTEPPNPSISIEQIRAVLAEKSQAGKTADVRTLLGKYGATKLSEIKAEVFQELLNDAEGL